MQTMQKRLVLLFGCAFLLICMPYMVIDNLQSTIRSMYVRNIKMYPDVTNLWNYVSCVGQYIFHRRRHGEKEYLIGVICFSNNCEL